MYFFLHVLPEVVSAVFSFLVEWFLFQEQPSLYGGTLSPLVTAWLYTAMMLAVWLLPIFYDACRRKGGMISTALNLLPAEVIFGGEFLYRLPLAGVAVLLLCGVVLWLLWYACYRRDADAWDAGKRGIEYDKASPQESPGRRADLRAHYIASAAGPQPVRHSCAPRRSGPDGDSLLRNLLRDRFVLPRRFGSQRSDRKSLN